MQMIRHQTIRIANYSFTEWSRFKSLENFFRPSRIFKNGSSIFDADGNAENLIWI